MMLHAADLSARQRPIALLVNLLSSGGAQRRIAGLANRFAELGRTVDVVSFDGEGPMRDMLAPSVRIVALGPSRPLGTKAAATRLRTYLDQAGPAVLMSCVTDTHAAAVAACRMGGGPIPLVLRASRHPCRSLPRWDLLRRAGEPIKRRRAARCYARADAIVALSQDGAEALRTLLGRRTARIETILNPVVERTWLDDPGRRRLDRAEDMPLVLGVGRLVRQKDFATLLHAFALVRAERPARLVLLGEGPERPRLQALAIRLGIAGDVAMPGEVGNVSKWMDRADLLVSSSLWEGMQATLVEALAAGCPVVATDCPGGARETLEDGRLGALVPVRTPVGMARAMLHQLDHPQDPRLLAAGALRFTPEGKAERYLAIFDSCSGTGAPAPGR